MSAKEGLRTPKASDHEAAAKEGPPLVGPVLVAGELAAVVVAAIRELNRDVTVHDRGAYLRVLVPQRCIVTRQAIERELQHGFSLPGDLEPIMPSFKGLFSVTPDQAVWWAQWRSDAP